MGGARRLRCGTGRGWSSAVFPAICALALAGCTGGPEIAPAGEEAIMAAAAPIQGNIVYSLRSGTWRYRVVEGEDEGAIVEHRRSPTDAYEATWRDDEDDRRSQFWTVNASGDIVMTAVLEHDDDALVRFDPPLVIAPATLEPGVEYRDEVEMRVFSAKNPQRQRERGTATRTIRYTGIEHIVTPYGSFEAHRIEIRFEADLRFADAEKPTVLWVSPGARAVPGAASGIGAVAEERSETVKVLGVFGSPKRQRLELVEHIE